MSSYLTKKLFYCGREFRPLTLYAVLALSGFSLVTLFASLVSGNWLLTKERIAVVNGSASYLVVSSGLWTKCSHVEENSRAEETMNCTRISYFIRAEKDGLGPTDSILLSLRQAVMFPMVCFIILITGQAVTIFAVVTFKFANRKQKIFIVIGALHIVSGLFLFIGLIIYIGAITDEAMDRSKLDPTEDHPPFLFSYGPSISLVVSTFFSGEMSGVLAIQFYFSLKRSNSKSINKNCESDEIEVDLADCVTSHKSSPRVRFEMLAKPQPKASKTTDKRPEDPARRDLGISLCRKEHKLIFVRDCVSKFGAQNKKSVGVDRVSERLSSPMFDSKMPRIQHRFNSTQRSVDKEFMGGKIISNNYLSLDDDRKQLSVVDNKNSHADGVNRTVTSTPATNPLMPLEICTRESEDIEQMFDHYHHQSFRQDIFNDGMAVEDFENKRFCKNYDSKINYITDHDHPSINHLRNVEVPNFHGGDKIATNPIKKFKQNDDSYHHHHHHHLQEPHNNHHKTSSSASCRTQPNMSVVSNQYVKFDKSNIDFKNKNTPV